MDTRKHTTRMAQANILGRVERLLGSDCDINPFPAMSKQWESFREGWLQALDAPISAGNPIFGKNRRDRPDQEGLLY
jgi:hypothetical protein